MLFYLCCSLGRTESRTHFSFRSLKIIFFPSNRQQTFPSLMIFYSYNRSLRLDRQSAFRGPIFSHAARSFPAQWTKRYKVGNSYVHIWSQMQTFSFSRAAAASALRPTGFLFRANADPYFFLSESVNWVRNVAA